MRYHGDELAPIPIMFSKLREDIKSIIERDPAARNGCEVLTCYPGLHAVIMHSWAHACWKMNLKWLGRFISYLARVITASRSTPAPSSAAASSSTTASAWSSAKPPWSATTAPSTRA